MNKSIAFHALFLAVGAVLAYQGLREKEEKDSKNVVLLNVDIGEISRIELFSDEKDLVITRSATEESKWVVQLRRTVRAKPKKKHKQTSTDGGTGPRADAGAMDQSEVKPEIKEFVFPASRNLTRSIGKLIPVQAKRDLGVVSPERLETMGLVSPKERLVIESSKGNHEWQLGKKTYGNQGRYARTTSGDRVYLLTMAMLRGFRGTESRLAERRMVDVETEKISSFRVKRKNKERTFVHHYKEQAKKRFFAPKDLEDEPSDDAKKFIAALRSVRIRQYVKGDVINGVTPEASFAVMQEDTDPVAGTLFFGSSGKGYLKVGRWVGELTESTLREILDDMDVLVQ